MKVNRILVISLLVLLTSCNRLHYPNRQNLVSLNDISALNGNFKNLSTDTTKLSMWRVLSMANRYKKPHKEYNLPNSYVQLIGKSRHSIIAKLFIDSTLVAQEMYKGKIKNNYFIVRRKVKYYGFPFIFGMEADCKLQFSKDSTNRIYIDDSFSTIGWVFIMVSGINSQDNYEYSPK